MAKKKEEPIANDETGKIKLKEKPTKQPDNSKTEGDVTKVKAKMKKPAEIEEEAVTKVSMKQPDQEVVNEPEVVEEVIVVKDKVIEEEEAPVLEEVITEQEVEEVLEAPIEVVEKNIEQSVNDQEPLSDDLLKLVNFMKETGGDLTDYVTLNQDYSALDNHTLLKEYYKSTKPHLTSDEVDFVMEDTFAYDEDEDDDRDIKRKKLAMKEQVAQARQHLDSVKSKYYEDIKAGSKLTTEQQKAIDFFNRHNLESEEKYELSKKQAAIFENKTNQVFNDKFKGFEYNVGEKKFRFNVKDTAKLKETQGDINNFIKKFLTEDNTIDDASGYHKGLFTAMNPDQIANHFYEQGKADALKNSIAKSKNVSMDPRQVHEGAITNNGFTVRALSNDSEDFKFRIKNKNK
tara:strand:+ start:3188 stop:4393 length:1206 start_codon:yes stop_codon:yes gene_type:complete